MSRLLEEFAIESVASVSLELVVTYEALRPRFLRTSVRGLARSVMLQGFEKY